MRLIYFSVLSIIVGDLKARTELRSPTPLSDGLHESFHTGDEIIVYPLLVS